jgi:hypothetical protein
MKTFSSSATSECEAKERVHTLSSQMHECRDRFLSNRCLCSKRLALRGQTREANSSWRTIDSGEWGNRSFVGLRLSLFLSHSAPA